MSDSGNELLLCTLVMTENRRSVLSRIAIRQLFPLSQASQPVLVAAMSMQLYREGYVRNNADFANILSFSNASACIKNKRRRGTAKTYFEGICLVLLLSLFPLAWHKRKDYTALYL